MYISRRSYYWTMIDNLIKSINAAHTSVSKHGLYAHVNSRDCDCRSRHCFQALRSLLRWRDRNFNPSNKLSHNCSKNIEVPSTLPHLLNYKFKKIKYVTNYLQIQQFYILRRNLTSKCYQLIDPVFGSRKSMDESLTIICFCLTQDAHSRNISPRISKCPISKISYTTFILNSHTSLCNISSYLINKNE